MSPSLAKMGRFKHLVDSPVGMEGFWAKYHIPQGVGLQYCPPNCVLTNKEVGEVVIPMIAFIERGMTLPIGRITRDYLLNHRLCSHQCAPNMFKVLGSVDALNDQMNLGLTWHDVAHMARRCSHVRVPFSCRGILPQILVQRGEIDILPSKVQ